jgi:predicted N-acetyltransferase YhbS
LTITAPEPISNRCQIEEFASGVASFDDWLKRRAYKNQAADASRTFVACEDAKVVGYYALASGGVEIAAAPSRFRRNMPEPIPIVVLGRLAVDHTHKGRGLGRALFRDSAKRVLHAADSIGIRGILVHAISQDAKAFYIALGFAPSPLEAMTLMVTLADLRAAL